MAAGSSPVEMIKISTKDIPIITSARESTHKERAAAANAIIANANTLLPRIVTNEAAHKTIELVARWTFSEKFDRFWYGTIYWTVTLWGVEHPVKDGYVHAAVVRDNIHKRDALLQIDTRKLAFSAAHVQLQKTLEAFSPK